MTQIAALLIFPLLMAYAAASDLLTMRISNKIPLALLGGFCGMAVAAGLPLSLIGWNLACGLLVLACSFALFAFGWIGGGDAKLAAGVALWLGWGVVLDFLLFGSVFGGVLTLLILQARRWPLPDWMQRHVWIARLHDQKQGVPYGIALAAAGLYVYPDSDIWLRVALS